jgi:hypothetical protein
VGSISTAIHLEANSFLYQMVQSRGLKVSDVIKKLLSGVVTCVTKAIYLFGNGVV